MDKIKERERIEPSVILSYLRKNGFPKLKALELSIFFGRHSTAQDAEIFLPHLKGADVFITECANHDKNLQPDLNALATGRLSPEKFSKKNPDTHLNTPFWTENLEYLFKSQIHIGIADVPAKSREAKELQNTFIEIQNFTNDIRDRQWSRTAARQILNARCQRFQEANDKRDTYILNNIQPALASALREDACNSDKTSFRAVVFMGTYHKTLKDGLQALHPETSVQFQESEPAFYYFIELLEKHRNRLPIPEKLLDNVLFGELVNALIGQELTELTHSPSEAKTAEKMIVQAMSNEQREIFYNLFIKDDINGLKKFLLNIIQQQKD